MDQYTPASGDIQPSPASPHSPQHLPRESLGSNLLTSIPICCISARTSLTFLITSHVIRLRADMTSPLDSIERLSLADLPTPLESAPRLGRYIGVSSLLIKRDDQTGLAMGGNKARKLEYDFADVIRAGSDVVVTVGGAQSNHARMTAAAARKLDIDVKLVLGGPEVGEYQGNMLLDAVFGAEIRYLKDNDDNDALAAAMDEWFQELKNEGRSPYAIPIGGSTGLSALGYVRAMQELAGQFGQTPVQIVLAVGSCGTLAGVLLGARLFMPRARIVGISVSRTSQQVATRTAELANEGARIIHAGTQFSDGDVESYDGYFGEYGAYTESGEEAIVACAQMEGILLDPVYTGKALAGLIDLVKRGVLRRDIPTIFIHTGGLPILFAYEKHLRHLMRWRHV
jgi:D-cysteine desulfhydrase family pyridoxal phosphate-dependent enzyme